MIDDGVVWLAIALMAAGTLAIRWSFPLVAGRMTAVPPPVERALRMIPPAALAALCVPAFVRPDGSVDPWSAELGAAILAGAVAWRTRSVPLTLAVGMIAVAGLRLV